MLSMHGEVGCHLPLYPCKGTWKEWNPKAASMTFDEFQGNDCFSLHPSCEEYREMVWAWNSWFHGGWRRRLTKKKHWVLAKCDSATSTRFSQQTQRAILEHVILNSVMGRKSEKHVIIFYYVHSTIWHHHKHDHPTSWCLQPPIHCECSVEAVAALEWRPALLQTLDFQDLRKARILIY